MCGIAGAAGRIDPELIQAVERMNLAQVHRGPDDEGIWRSGADAGVVLGHRRLAIIDLSARGHQPMVDPSTGNAISFNGEIYNFKALRSELRDRGVAFDSDTDTEVILRAYAAWGPAMIQRLRGMFAFAIWDQARSCVLLARDRMGIKPLYYTRVSRPRNGHAILFASELRALLASQVVERRLSPSGLSSYLWNGFTVGPGTILRDVELLPAGTSLEVSATGEISQPASFRSCSGGIDGAATLTELLEESVSMRLMSDVPLGIFLSGGVDSSLVAALAARTSSGEIRTFNVSFDEAEYDESIHAGRVARSLGTEHTDIRLSQSNFIEQLDDALDSLDQPSFDAINTYFVSRAVREAGITVALSGAGGDELFGGYTSFRDIPSARLWARLAAPFPAAFTNRIARAVMRAKLGTHTHVPPQTRWGKLADVLATRGDMTELYQVSYALFSRSFLAELAPGNFAETQWGLPEERYQLLTNAIQGKSELAAISELELSLFLGERLLRDTDSVSMAVSLEVRVPLIDHLLVEYVTGLPADERYLPLGRKQRLRDVAFRDLEPNVFERPKAGFVLPIDSWIRDAAATYLEAALNDSRHCESIGLDPEAVSRLWNAYLAGAKGIYWSRVWAIFALLQWTSKHHVSL